MPKPPKLTMREAEKRARAHDPAAWDAMSPAERRELVKMVNEHHAGQTQAAREKAGHAAAAEDLIRRTLPKPKGRR